LHQRAGSQWRRAAVSDDNDAKILGRQTRQDLLIDLVFAERLHTFQDQRRAANPRGPLWRPNDLVRRRCWPGAHRGRQHLGSRVVIDTRGGSFSASDSKRREGAIGGRCRGADQRRDDIKFPAADVNWAHRADQARPRLLLRIASSSMVQSSVAHTGATMPFRYENGSLALASLDRTCRDHIPTFPQRSPPSLLTTAACGGLRSAPDCRTRRALLHLSYSCVRRVDRRYS
jgi:hypothetical protein